MSAVAPAAPVAPLSSGPSSDSPFAASTTIAPFAGGSHAVEARLAERILARQERPVAKPLLDEACRYHRLHSNGRKSLARTLVEQDFATDAEIGQWFADIYGLRYVRREELNPKQESLSLINDTLARRCMALPLEGDRRSKVATIAIADFTTPGFSQVRYSLADFKITWVFAPYGDLIDAISRYYIPRVSVRDTQAENELSALVEQMLKEAADRRASDIHIDPDEHITRVFFRIDGEKVPWRQLPKANSQTFSVQVKLATTRGEDGRTTRADVSGGGMLDVARTDCPQDARASRSYGSQRFSLRFSVLPANFGETIVIRLLDQNAQVISLGDLGLLPDHITRITDTVQMPHGILSMVGPTGSGKSTTLAAALKLVDPMANRIMSAEDPIEYRLRGVQQVQVTKTMSFADVLRTALRQDPDVLLVGEMRDAETAQIATTGANTGHLILTTLHANTGVLGVNRLINLRVPPDLINATLRCLFAQRLIRRLCTKCRKVHPQSRELLKKHDEIIQIASQKRDSSSGVFVDYRVEPTFFEAGPGCPNCRNTGYGRRLCIAEARYQVDGLANLIMQADRTGVFDNRQAEALFERRLREHGDFTARTMREDGIIKAALGWVGIDDVLAETIEMAS